MPAQYTATIPSRSHPARPHLVTVDPVALTAACDCPSYRYRGYCRHQAEALTAQPAPARDFAAEHRAAQAARPRTPWVEEV